MLNILPSFILPCLQEFLRNLYPIKKKSICVKNTKLISKIDAALKRLKDGTYGFCEETGEPIGLKRLIARPIATLSITAQEKHEREEKIHAEL